jgi:asparagine synthase (glutamine-hydrolysing)
MCGIAGLVGGGWDDGTARVGRMLDLAAHRGPDGRGCLQREAVTLGHVRLAIVDRSHEADQPMRSEDGQVVIVFNGQIYNHVELRTELERDGWRFRTRSDTEVLLVAYLAWGRDCLRRFNGMWAFAIADFRLRRVFCARDRFGIKPFMYAHTSAGFVFASEPKQLLDLLPSRRPDLELIGEFVLSGLLDHHARRCFEGVQELAAGEWMDVGFDGQVADRGRWYSLAAEVAAGGTASAEQFIERLDDAVSLRLRADVPVGSCLSGGLDSSSVVASAAPAYARMGGGRMHAITAASEDPANDESALAQRMAAFAGLEWQVVQPTFDDFAETWDRMHWHQDEPVGGPSLVMQWQVMKAARAAGLVVMLDGQGGDEVLLGYDRYWPALLRAEVRAHGAAAGLTALRALMRNNESMSMQRLAMYAIGGRVAGLRQQWYSRRARLAVAPRIDALRDYGRNAFEPAALAITEIERTSLPALLRYEDRNSMAHAVEARLPFLDYRVVQAGLSLPIRQRSRHGWSKWPLRGASDTRLPPEIRWRRSKLGFNAPERLWLPRAMSIITSDVLASKILRELLGRRISDIRSLGASLVWRLASVACWERVFRL